MPDHGFRSVADLWPAYEARLRDPNIPPPPDGSRETEYAVISPAGELTWQKGTWYSSRDTVMAGAAGDGPGETGTEHLNMLPGTVFRYYAPFTSPDTRRMNKVANGMFWRLMAPHPVQHEEGDEGEPMLIEPSDRVIKVRGPVVIIGLGGDLTAEARAVIEETHTVVVAQLKGRGWL